MNSQQPLIYCWRYAGEPICKIGSCKALNIFFDSRLKNALTSSVYDIEVIGVCLCETEADARKLETDLLDQFERVREDREFVFYSNEVYKWIHANCTIRHKTTTYFQDIESAYAEDNRERNREYQAQKRRNARG